MVLDMGANVDCKPSHLYQFALMGSIYVEHHLASQHPESARSACQQKKKGNDLTREAHLLLKQAPLNYCGYVGG